MAQAGTPARRPSAILRFLVPAIGFLSGHKREARRAAIIIAAAVSLFVIIWVISQSYQIYGVNVAIEEVLAVSQGALALVAVFALWETQTLNRNLVDVLDRAVGSKKVAEPVGEPRGTTEVEHPLDVPASAATQAREVGQP